MMLKYFKRIIRKNVSTLHKEDMDILQERKVHEVCNKDTIEIARNLLIKGEVIGVPTDTVYGLACDANNEAAIQKLYSIKGRDSCKPVAICVKDIKALRLYGHAEHLSDKLLNELFPGPITIVIKRTKCLSNRFLNPTTNKIGIRIPDFGFIQKVCGLYHEQPLALTSANKSSEPSTLNINEFKNLWAQLGGVFDGGELGCTEEQRSASTVIDLSVYPYYRIVREGVALKKTLSILEKYDFKSIELKDI